MTKTALPALSAAIRNYNQNWRNLSILAVKTYALTHVISVIAFLFTDAVFGTNLIAKVKIYHEMIFGLFSFRPFNMPSPALVHTSHLETSVEIIIAVMSAWLTAPLYTSICRTMILGKKFDVSFLTRLTQVRCLKVALVSCAITFLLHLIILITSLTPQNQALVSLISCVYYFFAYYIMLRSYYLIPTIAVDNTPTSFTEGWILTRKKAWSILKLTFLVFLSAIITIGLIALVLQSLIKIPMEMGTVIILWTLTSGIFVVIFMPLFIAGIASLYRTSQENK